MSRIQQTLCCLIVAAVPAVAAAQDGETPAGSTAFFKVLDDGMEWPGWIIVAMSFASVTIIVEHFLTMRRGTMLPPAEVEAARQMVERREFKEVIDYVRDRRSMFSDVLTASLRQGRHGFDAMHEAAEERAGAWSSRLFRRVDYLHILGNLGPLMGLLGTVLGMIFAFGEMHATHGAYKPEDLARGISLALVNTFLGLVVAIVSLAFFGVCRNRVATLTVATHASVLDVLEYFRPAPFSAPTGAAAGSALPVGVQGPASAVSYPGQAGGAGSAPTDSAQRPGMGPGAAPRST